MRLNKLGYALTVAVVGVGATPSFADNVLSPGDFIIAIDNNRNLPGNTNTGGEGPSSAFDNADNTKWLSFGRSFTGLIVTPSGGPTAVQSLTFTSGGDAPERDPVAYRLFGTNGPVTAVNNGTGLEDNWTFIGAGATNLAPSSAAATPRNTTGAPSDIANTTAYASYKIVFTKLRAANAGIFDPVTLANAATPNSVQVSEVRMFDQAGGGGTNVALSPTAAVAVDQTDSFFPATERPVEAIDGSKAASSKYLNFGREGAGLIIKPARGATVVKSLRITTANDVEARDPSAYILYGTNSPITSIEDSEGDAEPWTMITSGTLALPSARNAEGDIVGFDNSTAYTSYKIVFTDNKGPDASANSIQFSELELFDTVPEPTSAGLLGLGAVGLLGRRRRRQA